MTYYLKYRPQNLEELDLVSVRETLQKILASGNIPHAFLFAGPKGTGKTSAARILAKYINCDAKDKPCNKCEQCKSITSGTNIDVIEMDAASHRGIDDIRILKDSIKLSPAHAVKKIYIIDEAHMLTTEASNALLKTLEEPPSHVIFILATTNPEKLIDTIRSRTTLVQFKKATHDEIKASLSRVITGENIKISDEYLDRIITTSGGGFRDAVKILERFAQEGSGDIDTFKDTSEFVKLMLDGNLEGALAFVEGKVKMGVDFDFLIKSILSDLQNKLLESKDGRVIDLIELLLNTQKLASDSPIEELPLQIAIIKFCKKNDDGLSSGNEEKIVVEKIEIKKEEVIVEKKEVDNKVTKEENEDKVVVPPTKLKQDGVSSLTPEIWQKVLASIKPVNASIEALLRSAHPEAYDGRVLSLNVYYKFHKERLEDIKNRKILEDVLTGVFGNQTKVECSLTTPPVKIVKEEVKNDTILTENKDQDILQIAEKLFS